MNLFVAKLSSATTSQDLEKLFGKYGEVVSAKVIFDKGTGNSKGYGFVEMKNEEEARTAITSINDTEVDGKQIVVKEAIPREEQYSPRKNLLKRGDFPPKNGNFGNKRF